MEKEIIVPIVIPYKQFDAGDELRLVLRSIEKNIKFNHKVVILGNAPACVDTEQVEVIRWNPNQHDVYPSFYNVQEKLHNFINTSDCEDFIEINDDIIFNKEINDAEMLAEHICIGVLPKDFKTDASLKWKNTILNTRKQLLERNPDKEVYNYSLHMPYFYNREKWLQLFTEFGIGKKNVVNMSTLYYNVFQTTKPKVVNKSKLKKCGIYRATHFEELLVGKEKKYHIINWSASQWNETLRLHLFDMFPDKSKFEL